MKKIVNKNTKAIYPYNRADDEQIIGLDEDLIVAEYIGVNQPNITTKQIVYSGPDIIDINKKTITKTWTIRDKTPEELAQHNRKIWLSTQEFYAEWTRDEKKKLIKAARTNDDVAEGQFELMANRGNILSDNASVMYFMDLAVANNIISAQRKIQILTKNA